MRRWPLLTCLLFLPACVWAQTAGDTIKHIRADYERTNRAVPRMRVVRLDLEEPGEGGEAVGYFAQDDVLRKMTVTHFGEMGKRVQEVYFLPAKRRFVLETVWRYDKPFGKARVQDQSRFYLSGDTLIRYIRNGKTAAPGDPDATRHLSALAIDIKEYKALLGARMSNP